MVDHSDKQEVEWQYDALDLRPVARWLESASNTGTQDGFVVEPLGEKKLSDTYLDTGDWRVYRAGFALRIRHKGEQGDKASKIEATMKLLHSSTSGDGPKVRREISESLITSATNTNGFGSLAAAEGPVGERLRSLAGGDGPGVLFRVETRRTTYRVSRETEDMSSAEVALDETEIPLPDGEPVSLKRVEVELEEGNPEDFADFVEGLSEHFRLTPASTSKFEAGIFSLGLTPPEPPDLGPTAVSADSTTGEVAYAVLREQFGVFLAHEAGTRIGEDPEELHDMRVASRRMRAAIKVFRDALPVRAAHFGRELKWIASFLGGVRDLDVQLGQLDVWISEAEAGEDRASLGELRVALEKSRHRARRTMLRSLESRRYNRFVEAYPTFLLRGPSRRSVGARIPVIEAGPGIIRKAYRKFRRPGDAITKDSPAAEYHELRKRGKRLRYALEFLTPIYGNPAKEMTAALKKIQDVLGDHQDAALAAERLRELAPTRKKPGGLVPRTFFIMGGIASRYEARAAEMKKLFPETYSGIKGKPRKRLEKAMKRSLTGQVDGSA